MSVFTPDMKKQVASLVAESEVEQPIRNAERLEAWKRRYWHNTVEVPALPSAPLPPVVGARALPLRIARAA